MIRNGNYTVVNPRTGGNRTVRIREMPRNFVGRLGTRFAEFLGERHHSANPAHDGGGDGGDLLWIGFAFINADGRPVFWKRFLGDKYLTQRAALKFVLSRKGEALGPWMETNFQRLYGGTPVALDKHNPNPVEAAVGVAAEAWDRGGDDDG